MVARKKMQNAHVLVVNHSLFFSELALRADGAALLPSYGYVVFDEAHQMEQVASSHLGIRLSLYMIEYCIRRIYSEKQRGLCSMLKDGKGAFMADQCREAANALFENVRAHFKLGPQKTQQRIFEPPPIETDLPLKITNLCQHLKTLLETIDDDGIAAEIKSLRNRGLELRDSVESFLRQSLEGHVYWTETQGRRRLPVLYSAPVDVGPILREMLFEEVPCVVMTSATLAVGNNLSYFRHRIGAETCASDRHSIMRGKCAFKFPPPCRPLPPTNLRKPPASPFAILSAKAAGARLSFSPTRAS